MKKLTLFKRKTPKGLECLNCLMPLRGDENFCPSCGQKNDVRKLRVSHFFTEFLAGFISYDSTLWRTLKPILLSPGKVSLEYIKGKRKRYVNPFRFYFSVSIIYFLVIGLSSKWGDLNSSFEGANYKDIINIEQDLSEGDKKTLEEVLFKTDSVLAQNEAPALDSISSKIDSIGMGWKITKANTLFKKHENLSVIAVLDSLDVAPTFFNKALYHKIKTYSTGNDKENLKAFINSLVSNISVALFFLLPIFTLFVWFLYLRKRFSYMEHLVFVFNTQTVLFLLLLILFFVDLIMGEENQWWLTFLLFSVYLFLALRGFYQQGFFKTVFKYFILNSVFFLLASVGLLIISGMSFLFS